MSGDPAGGRKATNADGGESSTHAQDDDRRADWRFVLPALAPWPVDRLVLLGGHPDEATVLVTAGLARSVDQVLAEDGGADVVVGLAGGPEAGRRPRLHDAAAAVRPGGVLYWEFRRRSQDGLLATPSRVRSVLRRAGLRSVAAYWVKPGFGRRDMYLPVDVDGPLAWYLDTIYRTPTRGRSLLAAAIRAGSGGHVDRFGRLVPHLAITAIRDQGATARPTADPSPRPPAALAAALADPLVAPLLGGASRALLMTGGQGPWSRVALLLFNPGDAVPTAVLKIHRDLRFADRTDHEQATLAALRDRLGPALGPTVPRPLGIVEWAGLRIGAESYAPGASLHRTSGDWGARRGHDVEDLGAAAAWIREFHAATAERVTWRSRREEIVERPIVAYRSTFGATAADERLFEALRHHARDLDVELPWVWHHRDFGPWNVLRSGSRVSVIDWEVATQGPPAADLVYFSSHWCWLVAGHRTELDRGRDVAWLFAGGAEPGGRSDNRRIAAAVHIELGRYLARLRVDRRLLPHLIVFTFIEQALDRAGRLADLGDPAAADRAGNPYVGYVSVLAGRVDGLLALGSTESHDRD